jgi:predicted nucleic acid-binding protein
MNDKVFLDTNVLVYLYSEDEPEKQAVAICIFDSAYCITSTQVLNEFCAVCLRKLGMSSTVVLKAIREIAANCECCLIDMEVIQNALSLHNKYGYAYYDCLVLASAISNDCNYLYSEDINLIKVSPPRCGFWQGVL